MPIDEGSPVMDYATYVPNTQGQLGDYYFFKRKHQFYNWENITHNDPLFRDATK